MVETETAGDSGSLNWTLTEAESFLAGSNWAGSYGRLCCFGESDAGSCNLLPEVICFHYVLFVQVHIKGILQRHRGLPFTVRNFTMHAQAFGQLFLDPCHSFNLEFVQELIF